LKFARARRPQLSRDKFLVNATAPGSSIRLSRWKRPRFARLEDIAWQAYDEGRKAPLTRLAGPGYADPTYALSVEWLATRQAIDQAQLTLLGTDVLNDGLQRNHAATASRTDQR